MIKSSEDANKYYQLVNQYIDEYVDQWKIKPTNLKNYLLGNKSRLVKFLERKGLKDISNINQVLLDVVEDRVAMFNDGVLTFENFQLFESNEFKIVDLRQCLYKGINNATIEHEKILADEFDVSLSEIDIISAEKHQFKIDSDNIVIYTDEEMSIIKENIKDYILNQVFNKSVKLELGSSNLDLDINVKEFINNDKFLNHIDSVLDNSKIVEIISTILSMNPKESNWNGCILLN
jgi:hypothetical protein